MEGSDNEFPSSNHPPKSTASLKPSFTGSGENNENELSQEQMSPMLENPKKTVSKNIMSPTMSPASKAAAPREKILVERDGNSSSLDGQIHKAFNHVANRSPKHSSISNSNRSSSQAVPLYKRGSKSDNDEYANFVADSSLESPRPEFLRFNPKRSEILNRLGKEGREDLTGSLDSKKVSDEEELSEKDVKGSSLSPKKESIVKQENTENEDENTNDNDDDCDGEDEDEFEENGRRFRGVMKFLLLLIAYFLSTSYICNMNSPTPSTTQQAIQGLKVGYLMIQKQTIEAITMKMHNAGLLAVEKGDIYVDEVEIDQDDNVQMGERVEPEMVEDDGLDNHKEELVGNDNGSNAINEAVETEDGDGDESVVEMFEQWIDDTRAAESEVVGSEVESKSESFEPLIGAIIDESEDAVGYGLEKESGDFKELGQLETSVDSSFERVDGEELLETNESCGKAIDSIHEVEVEANKDGWNASAMFGVPVVSLILASVLFIYRLKKEGRSAQETQPMPKPYKCTAEEKVTALLPAMEKKVEFFARPSVSMSIEEEAPENLNYHIHAPTVELIGEIVVGEVNSSCRGNGRKNQVIESEERYATFYQKQGSAFQQVTSSNPPSSPNFSNAKSPSHGSFTDKRKILKEGGKDEEPRVKATPVRRSSRIRSRTAVMSP